MVSKKRKSIGGDLRKYIERLMFFRVVLISVLLWTSIVLQISQKGSQLVPDLKLLYILIGFTYFLTAIYIILIRILKGFKTFAYVQFFMDIVIVTALIFITGGIESIFTFLYILIIISASIILYRPGGFLTASFSGILYGVLVELDYYEIIPSSISYFSNSKLFYQESDIFYNIFINVVAFYLSAFLSGYLAEQLKKAGEQLIAKEIDYEELKILNNDIIQNIQTGVITINTNDEIISINRQAEIITGITLEEVYLKPIENLLSGILPKIEEIVKTHYQNNINRWTMKYETKDNRKYILGFSVSPLKSAQGKTTGKIVLFQDITRVTKMEEEVRNSDRLATLGKLAANLAHEIRNPLAAMSGSIQILKSDISFEGKNINLMEIVLQEIDRLNHLITDFLMYAKPIDIKKERLNITNVIDETIAVFKNTPKGESKIQIETIFSGDTNMNGDFQQLKQVFWNIFLNSADAMPNGGTIKVNVGANYHAHGGLLVITITDTGTGIDENVKSMIFDPFFSTKEGGTGLGLSTVKQIVEVHCGIVEIDSEINKGTDILIAFPRD
jgi:two-component system, NtrC family, sensor histidine kinase PilS